ncbi:VOC family protein [Alicyclobacillus tolerans]|uniref:VOC family protein n=1 Tax=Alicyclobacillus tolerans TaxID=90970 RepID=UPI001F25490D|nr:VOC family protein [Alicyclobacillus tolerans]MCF8565033.1 VOC family protein [Alicyclobacillus tolerans]
MTIQKLEHVGIFIKNTLEESAAFYQQVFGLELKSVLEHKDPSIRLGFLGFPGDENTVIELVEGANTQLPPQGVVNHVAFTVDDVEAEVSRLRAQGIQFDDEGILTLRNGAKYIFLEGPSGERLELFQGI